MFFGLVRNSFNLRTIEDLLALFSANKRFWLYRALVVRILLLSHYEVVVSKWHLEKEFQDECL